MEVIPSPASVKSLSPAWKKVPAPNVPDCHSTRDALPDSVVNPAMAIELMIRYLNSDGRAPTS